MRNTVAEHKVRSLSSISEVKNQVVISPIILKKIYSSGSLKNCCEGVGFCIKNQIRDAMLTGVSRIVINGTEIPPHDVFVGKNGSRLRADMIDQDNRVCFPLGQDLQIHVSTEPLRKNQEHHISLSIDTDHFGMLSLDATDTVMETRAGQGSIPCVKDANYEMDIVHKRQEFVENFSGVKLHHIKHHSFDPALTRGNIENFTGVAQIPMGFAGPLKVNGEYAKGEFLIPLCASEGTLVASYNRGMKILNMSGGITTTIVEDQMQRAPVFVFESSRQARDFSLWLDEHMEEIRSQAESTSKVARLLDIEKYLASKFVYLRFNYYTGDAAGQNMVSMATFVACNWILAQYKEIKHFYMESNMATDKKCSQINTMNTRGKRVVAEFTVPRDILIHHMRVDPDTLVYHSQVANLGAFMAGSSSNGLHCANALAALFIATGQDVANVAEASTGLIYTEVTSEGDLYASLTLPSLIVATYGGGTGLPTQRECLDILGCYGQGKVKKFTEIVAAAALAGELSLASAISSLDWVTSHERLGKNR
ncbi:MAG: hydroxymethylglutaryl-CoA reductase [Desulfomonilia bacterium]|jgi:hydroxymethylglutaryl-CoA reductase (NADPH)|nr:hydroxymethylglutaryl-CoA reductase [Deltaproteobacteria bacterium]MDX9761212.1 hydroxymethylglutaryl-CoA reductase [Desulfomonilia bacterium]